MATCQPRWRGPYPKKIWRKKPAISSEEEAAFCGKIAQTVRGTPWQAKAIYFN
jgi:hypothetical protein